ncbi:MAG: hypothetical protein LBF24_02070 [Puniceicoccales bacterium]|nr:hypothetical protein [Puniceicoccales bacterium]
MDSLRCRFCQGMEVSDPVTTVSRLLGEVRTMPFAAHSIPFTQLILLCFDLVEAAKKKAGRDVDRLPALLAPLSGLFVEERFGAGRDFSARVEASFALHGRARAMAPFAEFFAKGFDERCIAVIVGYFPDLSAEARKVLGESISLLLEKIRKMEGEKLGTRGRIDVKHFAELPQRPKTGFAKILSIFTKDDTVRRERFLTTLRSLRVRGEECFGAVAAVMDADAVIDAFDKLLLLSGSDAVPLAACFRTFSANRMLLVQQPLLFIGKALLCFYKEARSAGSQRAEVAMRLLRRICSLPPRDEITLRTNLLAVPIGESAGPKLGDLVVEIDGEFQPRMTCAGLCDLSNLPVWCGPSGTTIDFLIMVHLLQPEYVTGALASLLDFLTSMGTSELSVEFRGLFTQITFYMALKEYHSPAEVLAAFLATALAVAPETESGIAPPPASVLARWLSTISDDMMVDFPTDPFVAALVAALDNNFTRVLWFLWRKLKGAPASFFIESSVQPAPAAAAPRDEGAPQDLPVAVAPQGGGSAPDAPPAAVVPHNPPDGE